MAKHTRTSSQEALLESLKSQNTQIQVDLGKLTEEMKEIKKYLEGKMTATYERFNELQEMFINLMRKQSDKEPMLETDQSSAQSNLEVEVGSEKNGRNIGTDGEIMGTGRERPMLHRTQSEDTFHVNTEEYNWDLGYIRGSDRRQNAHNTANNAFILPRIEFPKFDGGDPLEWRMNCEFYFYQVPELYKTRMAVMYFYEELNE
jgi:hypothetical protein